MKIDFQKISDSVKKRLTSFIKVSDKVFTKLVPAFRLADETFVSVFSAFAMNGKKMTVFFISIYALVAFIMVASNIFSAVLFLILTFGLSNKLGKHIKGMGKMMRFVRLVMVMASTATLPVVLFSDISVAIIGGVWGYVIFTKFYATNTKVEKKTVAPTVVVTEVPTK